jgi:hypothetical protein
VEERGREREREIVCFLSEKKEMKGDEDENIEETDAKFKFSKDLHKILLNSWKNMDTTIWLVVFWDVKFIFRFWLCW